MNIRTQAAKALCPVLQQKRSLDAGMESTLKHLAPQDKGLFHTLCLGTLRQYESLHGIAQGLLNKPLRNKDMDVYALILMGLYQIRDMRIPDHAAISECVNGAKQLKKLWAVKLVNATLRHYLRTINSDDAKEQPSLSPDHGHNCPPWLLKALRAAWADHWQAIVLANADQPPLTLRFSDAGSARDRVIAELNQRKLAWSPCEYAPWGIRLNAGENVAVSTLSSFQRGDCSVQDEAAQLAGEILAPQAHDRVLDACCAPGGKLCHLLQRQPALKQLVGLELEPQRWQRVEENLTRLNLQQHPAILGKTGDATQPDTWWDGDTFDRILLDVPCSATGVIRRHPDIKLLRREDDIAALVALQQKILQAIWPLLKPGGRLLYATCSILPAENSQQIAAFLTHEPLAKLIPLDVPWGEAQPFGRQLLPQPNGHDGFYYALLEKPA